MIGGIAPAEYCVSLKSTDQKILRIDTDIETKAISLDVQTSPISCISCSVEHKSSFKF